MKINEQSAILPLIVARWSPRAFASQVPEQSIIKRLIQAAGMAPSAYNEQPWGYIVGFKGDATWQLIYNTLMEGNQVWAVHAPVLMLSVGRSVSSRDQTQPNPSWMYDLGQSVAYLSLQAAHEGLFVHQMGGFFADEATRVFCIPDSWKPMTAIAIGYKGAKADLPADLAAMENGPKKRKEFATFVFSEKFDDAAPWL